MSSNQAWWAACDFIYRLVVSEGAGNQVKTKNLLGYEQLLALQMMRDSPDMEISVIMKATDSSIDDLYHLWELLLIDIGFDRLQPNELHPMILIEGEDAVAAAEADGIINAMHQTPV